MQLRKRHKKSGYQSCPKCNYCGIRITVKNYSEDHMQPLARGGSNARDNRTLSCRSCNGRKADRDVEEFRAFLENERGVPVVFCGERS